MSKSSTVVRTHQGQSAEGRLPFSAGLQRHPFQQTVHCLGQLCQSRQQEVAKEHRLHIQTLMHKPCLVGRRLLKHDLTKPRAGANAPLASKHNGLCRRRCQAGTCPLSPSTAYMHTTSRHVDVERRCTHEHLVRCRMPGMHGTPCARAIAHSVGG